MNRVVDSRCSSRIKFKSSILYSLSGFHSETNGGAEGERPRRNKSVRNDGILVDSGVSDLGSTLLPITTRSQTRAKGCYCGIGMRQTYLLHGRAINSKSNAEPILRSELRSTALSRSRKSVRKSLGLVSWRSGRRRNWDREVRVLPSALFTTMDTREQTFKFLLAKVDQAEVACCPRSLTFSMIKDG